MLPNTGAVLPVGWAWLTQSRSRRKTGLATRPVRSGKEGAGCINGASTSTRAATARLLGALYLLAPGRTLRGLRSSLSSIFMHAIRTRSCVLELVVLELYVLVSMVKTREILLAGTGTRPERHQ